MATSYCTITKTPSKKRNAVGFVRQHTVNRAYSAGPQPRQRAIDAPDAGMTLLELAFAAAIMASTLVFLLGAIVNISDTSDIAGDQAAVMAHISTIVEELRDSSEYELLAYVPPAPPPGGPNQTVRVEYVINEDGQTMTAPQITEAGTSLIELPNPLPVRITVTALSKSGRRFVMQAATVVRR